MPARRRCFGLVLGATIAVGCGSRSALDTAASSEPIFPWESSIAPARVRRPPACVQDWRTLHAGRGPFPPSIGVADGELIFGELAESGAYQLRALDLSAPSDTPRTIHSGLAYEELWLEADRLLVQSDGRLFGVQISDGREELVLDARGPDPALSVRHIAVQHDTFYWARPSANPGEIELWQQQREGGTRRLIARLDDRRLDVQLMTATGERVLFANGFTGAAVSIADGAVQPFASVEDGDLAGIDGMGAYFVRAANRTLRGGRALQFEIRRAPADGSPTTRFWHRRAGHHLSRIWPAESGWLATGAYYMFDRRPHGVIAHIDESGHELLIACNRGDEFSIARPVYWDGAFYTVTRTDRDNTWQLVEIRVP